MLLADLVLLSRDRGLRGLSHPTLKHLRRGPTSSLKRVPRPAAPRSRPQPRNERHREKGIQNSHVTRPDRLINPAIQRTRTSWLSIKYTLSRHQPGNSLQISAYSVGTSPSAISGADRNVPGNGVTARAREVVCCAHKVLTTCAHKALGPTSQKPRL